MFSDDKKVLATISASATTSVQSFASRGGAQAFRDYSVYLAGILSRQSFFGGLFIRSSFEDGDQICRQVSENER